jgi:hypothetical protein
VAVVWLMSDLHVIEIEKLARVWVTSEAVVQLIRRPQEDRPYTGWQVRPPRRYPHQVFFSRAHIFT